MSNNSGSNNQQSGAGKSGGKSERSGQSGKSGGRRRRRRYYRGKRGNRRSAQSDSADKGKGDAKGNASNNNRTDARASDDRKNRRSRRRRRRSKSRRSTTQDIPTPPTDDDAGLEPAAKAVFVYTHVLRPPVREAYEFRSEHFGKVGRRLEDFRIDLSPVFPPDQPEDEKPGTDESSVQTTDEEE